MRVLNTVYKDSSSLKEYISKNGILDCDNILIQVFTGVIDKEYIDNLILELKTLIPKVKIIGTTTDGEICQNRVTSKETVLSFLLLQKSRVSTYYADGSSSLDVANNMINLFKDSEDAKLFITFIDGLSINSEAYIKVFEEFDNSLVVAGGLAGDNAEFKKTFIFTEKGCFNSGAVGVLFHNRDLIVNTDYNFGWENIGKSLKVTDAKHNIVYTINDKPIKDIYAEYLGEKIADMLPATGIEFPLIINRNGMSIARAVLSSYDDGSLAFAGNIDVGDIVQFGYGNVQTILSGNRSRFKNLDKKPSEAFFIYSCMARRHLLGSSIVDEILPFSDVGDVSGFFSYGEIYHDSNSRKNEILNQTMTILSISESEDSSVVKSIKRCSTRKDDTQMHTMEALSHLVSVASKEILELNHTLEQKVKEQVKIIEQKQSQLIERSRQAVMGDTIGTIAHQWRQPLAAISSNIFNLAIDVECDRYDKERFKNTLLSMEKQIQFLSSTINDFRDFFKKNKERVLTTIEKVVEDTLIVVSPSLKSRGILFKKDFRANIEMMLYSNELKQVILNLIKNAEDILTEREISNPTIYISTYSDNSRVYLEVRDNGGGVCRDIINRIFEPYFTTKNTKDGTGIGLYMSKVIIEESLKGEISVKNEEDGAVFKIGLKVTNG